MKSALKCYIAARPEADTSAIRAILRTKGVQPLDAFDYSEGDELHDSLIAKIREANCAIAVLDEPSIAVAYEAGLCDGMEVPILVIISGLPEVPALLGHHLQLRTSLRDSETLRLTIGRFVDEARTRRRRRRTPSRQKPEQPRRRGLAKLVDRISELRNNGSAREVEDAAFELLLASGVETVRREERVRDRGVDFAIWSDDLGQVLGNPLLVEVKTGRLSAVRIRVEEMALLAHLKNAGSNAAILLYLDKLGRRFKEQEITTPWVFRYDLEDFAKQLRRRDFASVVLETRNRLVHRQVE
jgi:hypothetical protein